MPPLDPDDQDPNMPQSPDGEYAEIPDDEGDPDVQENEDGSAIVQLSDKTEVDEHEEFFANLAEKLPRHYLSAMATELLDLIEKDQESRKSRDKLYAEGLKRAGLTDDKGEDSSTGFEGGSTVTHPVIIESCIDFAARVVKELLPPEGPVKDKVIGTATNAKVEKARRKVKHMNWQLTQQIKEFRPMMEQGCTQIPPGGAFYMKMWWSKTLGRVTCKAVYVDDVYLPYSASSFETALRRTHVIYTTDQEFEQDVESGMYATPDYLTGAGQEPEKSETSKTSDEVEGKESTGYNEDGLRVQYETQLWKVIDGDDYAQGELAPYIVTIDLVSRSIVGIYRNWDPEKTDLFEELPIMVEFPFIPWRGAFPLTIFHLIGSLSVAATGALRCLLDSGFVNTVPSLAKLKGGLGDDGGQSKDFQPGEVTEINGGLATDDVSKQAFQMNFNPPAPVLFELLGFLVDAAKGVVQTTFDELADSNANVPVGTTLARYEQGTVVFSSIHARLHAALAQVFAILHRLNKFYLKDSVTKDEAGEILAYRSDYEGPVDVVPVSDPRIFSDTQRFVQISAVVQRATNNPLYKQREVEKLWLKQTHVPEAEKLLVDEPTPRRMNAVNENLALLMKRPVSAFPEQDHEAHLNTHLPFMMSPVIGALPIVVPALYPEMLQHVIEHVGFWYVSKYHDEMSRAAGVEITELMDEDPQIMAEFDRFVAKVTPTIMKEMDKTFAKLPPIITQALQLLQKMSPQQPQDPTAQALAAETARKGQKDQMDAKAADQKVQLSAAELKLQAAKQQQDAEQAAADRQAQQQRDAQAAQLQQQKDQQQADLQAQQQAQAAADAEKQRQLDAAKLAQDGEKHLRDAAQAAADMQAENDRKAADLRVKTDVNTADNETALTIAKMEVEAGRKSNIKTGTGINPQ